MRALALLVGLGLPAAALADATVSDELTVSGGQPTPESPRSGSTSDRLSGTYELSDAWELHADASLTHDNATPAQAGAAFSDTGGNILLFDLGADWLATEHFSFGAEGSFSPRSTQRSNAQVTLEEGAGLGVADALVRSTSSSAGALFTAGWLSDEDAPEATAVDASLGLTRYDTEQSIAAIETARGTVAAANITAYCNAHPRACGGFQRALEAQPAALSQARLGLGVTQTLRDDTDLSLFGAYYLYDQDPTEVGYFSIATVGRTVSLGTGVPLAPLWYSLRAGATHRFGRVLSLSAWYQRTAYVAGLGGGNAVGLKAQVRLSGALRLWVGGSGDDDVDSGGTHSKSGSLSVGARYLF